MEKVKFVISVLLIGAIYCEDVLVQDGHLEDNSREVREFNPEGWRAVEKFTASDLGWIPRDEITDLDQIKIKRRRIRKRKRRPPLQNAEEGEVYPRRRLRPFRLDQITPAWEDLSITEENIKPNNRRRLPLPNPTSEEIDKNDATEEIVSGTQRKDVQEKPLGTSILVEEKSEPQLSTNSLSDLKTLLKKSGGKFSLSEILQQKNLSLSELLMGNERAISALTENPEKPPIIIDTTTEQSNKYKRLPPSIALKPPTKTSVQEDSTEDSLSAKETLDAQRKRLALLQPKENKIFTTVIKFDVINEPTTDRRIFIPANSKYSGVEYIHINSDEGEMDSTTERKITIPSTTISTTSSTSATEKIKDVVTLTPNPSSTTKAVRYRGKLPTTNAKLRITTKKVNQIEKESYPVQFAKPIKIDISELIGFHKNEDNQKEEAKTDGPMKVSIDLEAMFDESNKKLIEQSADIPEPIIELTTNNSEDQNETYVTAKQEIMEVIKDPISREKLSRILEYRNMTIEELVEQRERGSSQLHLADIFHNKTREPEPKDEPFVGQINPEFIQNIKTSYRQQKSTKLDDVTAASTSTSTTNSVKEITTKSKQKEIFPTVTVKLTKNSDGVDTFPWKQLYPNLFPETNEIDNKDSRENINEFIESLDIENRLTANTDDDDGIFNSIPSGVKSAILVSLAIIGLSITVFLAVLLVLKWIQRKNKSMNYCGSLTTKFRTPMMLQGRPTTAIKTFMNETLGRKKNYYKSTLQSMSDEIWDASRDRKESF